MKLNTVISVVVFTLMYTIGGQTEVQQSIQGQRVVRTPGGPITGASSSDAPSPIPEIDGISIVRDGVYRVTDTRPMEQATKLLERKLGVPIWYEDPVWAFNGDLVQASDLPANRELAAKNLNWRGPLVPRAGTFDFTLPTTTAALTTVNVLSLLEAVNASYGSFRNTGRFKVVQFGDNEFSIVGIRAAGKDGRLVDQMPPLDHRLSFPETDRTLADTLKLICDSINVRLMVEFRGGPENSRHVRIGANNEAARDVLARAMRIPGGMKVSWVLSYMPDLQAFILGLRAAQAEVTTSTGSQLHTLLWPN